MRYASLLVAGLLLAAGCGGKKDSDPTTRKSGTLTAHLTPNPDPPSVGHDAGFILTLSQNGQPVSAARVGIALFYKNLNQTGPTNIFSEEAPGTYRVRELSLGMGGRWDAEVTVSRDSQPDVKLIFPFTTSK